MSNGEYAATLSALLSRGCHVSREWLTECINFFRSENNQSSLRDLENFVFDQWILGDLRDIAGGGSFPPNLNDTLKITLEGKMACQVEFLTDIGHSAYSQMQKVRNEDVGNLKVNDTVKDFQQAWEPKSNRCLQLTLCDGVQTIKAIEYKPLPSLKTDLIPGTKILLQGPVLCRKGVVMLEERHLTILGGEVDALVIVNAYENVLARKLNLPENPDPYNMTAVNNAVPAAKPHPAPQPPQPNNQQQPPRQQLQPPPSQPRPQTNNVNPVQLLPLTQTSNINHRKDPNQSTVARAFEQAPRKLVQRTLSWSKQAQQPSKSAQTSLQETQPLEFSGSDEDFLDIPLDAADWEEKMNHGNGWTTSSQYPRNSSNNLQRQPAEFNDDFEMGSDEEALLLEAEASLALYSAPASKPQNSLRGGTSISGFDVPQKCSYQENITTKRSASSALSDDSLRKPLFAKRRKETSSQEVTSSSDLNYLLADNLFDFEEMTSEIPDATGRSSPITLPSHPFVYLSQIMENNKSCETFRAKAAVITVIEKLSISQNEWKLSAKISDGSANVDVRFSAKVLEELIGMSATDMTFMKKQIAQHPENKEIIRKKLEKAQGRLINLNCLLDIKLNMAPDLPEVVGIEDISSSTVSALKARQACV